MRKLSVLVSLVLLFSLFVADPAQAAKSYHAEYFDVQIDLQEGGSAIVTETVKFHFEGNDPFTFAFREIPAAHTDGITFIDASMDGTPMPVGTQTGQVEVEAGDPFRVTWHFPPASEATHEFTVSYRADGIIRKQAGDVLVWQVIPQDRGYRIDSSSIVVTYPPGTNPIEPPRLNQHTSPALLEDHFILTDGWIHENQGAVLTVKFAKDSLTLVTPHWQAQQQQLEAETARALPMGFAAGTATLILGIIVFFIYVWANRRKLNIQTVITRIPPSDISPAIIGKLTGQQSTFMGTILDLAQRGILEVQEQTGFWGTYHVLVRKDHTGSLQPHEQGLMNTIFSPNETQIGLNDVAIQLSTNNYLFDKLLEQELVRRGWLDPARKQKQTMLSVIGLMALFLVIALFIIAMLLGTSWGQTIELTAIFAAMAGIGIGVCILALALLIYAGTFSILTPAGEEQAARWKGFAKYLRRVSTGREPAVHPDYLERYLAYAAVFGLGANWTKYFQRIGSIPLPIWFHAATGSNADFGTILVVMSAAEAAAAGADGGASGGGASGAG
ncbi:MAG TPA: DUF2207 domain-containing protein [Anaerolineales bacterium]|nr:DUF2207 domain-containing protein [Anaerolineales bacterium]